MGTPNIFSNEKLLKMKESYMQDLKQFYNSSEKPFILKGYTVHTDVSIENATDELLENKIALLKKHCEKILADDMFLPVSLEFLIYGVHFVDKLFGAQVVFNSKEGIWCSNGVECEIGQLQPIDFETNELWLATKKFYEKIFALNMKVPFITTQVLGSLMVGIYNIYKEKLFYAFYDTPDEIKRDLRVLADALLYMHKWFKENIPAENFQPICVSARMQPENRGQLCGCTTQLISKEIYDEFIYPLDKEILQLYPDGGMYHLCGSHAQHIETFKNFEELKSVQLGGKAADDLMLYFNGLRDDQVIYFRPNKNISAEMAIELTKGKRLIIT